MKTGNLKSSGRRRCELLRRARFSGLAAASRWTKSTPFSAQTDKSLVEFGLEMACSRLDLGSGRVAVGVGLKLELD